MLSYSSLEDATHSFADDIINPGASSRASGKEENESTHWHSTPLVFAILPAVGGLLFQNGSAFITDILLLGLAAIFMNWSIRVPWDWYYSAQALQKDLSPYSDDTILEEEEPDEQAVETASSGEGSAKTAPADSNTGPQPQSKAHNADAYEHATAALRTQELLALGAIFTFPALAAYLLHVIRAQLSRPSTGLVSDYNIGIFLLAAEIRPCRQLIRLVANRTLHLQRTVTGLDEPFASSTHENSTLSDVMTRIAGLEDKLSTHQTLPPTLSIAQKADVTELSTELRKRYEPRLEGLERAVRRYEKRSTTLAMLTEQRLNSLETRLQDALSLAAVAAQHSQRRGVVATTLETLSAILAMPLRLAWAVCVWPFVALEELYDRVRVLMLGPAPSMPSSERRAKAGGAEEKARASKGSSTRKLVR